MDREGTEEILSKSNSKHQLFTCANEQSIPWRRSACTAFPTHQQLAQWESKSTESKICYDEDFKKYPTISFSNITDQN